MRYSPNSLHLITLQTQGTMKTLELRRVKNPLQVDPLQLVHGVQRLRRART